MIGLGYAIFETAVGLCAVAWGEDGLIGVQLPEGDRAAAEARLRRRFPGVVEAAPDAAVQAVIDDIVALLAGEYRDLAGAALDLRDAPEFNRRVYAAARSIPPGATLTYGEIAARLGETDYTAARAVGQVMASNPFPIVVSCHRVLAAGGRSGGVSANGGVATKRRLLAIESVHARGAPSLLDLMRPA